MRYMLCYFNCNEYLVSDIWDVSLYNDQFREIKVDEYFFFSSKTPSFGFRKFSREPSTKVPFGWFLGAGDAKKSLIFGS